MMVVRWRSIHLLLAAVLLAPGLAVARSSDPVEWEGVLRGRFLTIEKLREQFPDSGYYLCLNLLQEEVRAALDEFGDDRPLRLLDQQVLFAWCEAQLDRNKPKGILDLLGGIYEAALSDPLRKGAAARAGPLAEKAADAEKEEGDKLDELKRCQQAVEFYTAAGREEDAKRMERRIETLRLAKALLAFENRDYAAAWADFEIVLRDLGSFENEKAKAAWKFLREETGVVEVDLFAVDVDDAVAVAGNGRIALVATSGGESWEGEGDPPDRWVRGTYDVSLRMPDGRDPATLVPVAVAKGVEIDPSAPARVRLPSRVPVGMLYVPAGGGVSRPFFIDRTEVTEFEFRNRESGSKEMPAANVRFKEASDWARDKGKQLPTKEQWLWAAFGGTGWKFPWGNEADYDGRANLGSEDPMKVTANPGGASPFGALNMAGNVWEWLSDGWAIGGGFLNTLELYRDEGLGNPLRDPKPDSTLDIVNTDPKWDLYQVSDDNREEVGFRCVIEIR